MTRVLIIGGTGFLGRALYAGVRAAGWTPVVFADDVDPAAAGSDPAMIRGDLLVPDDLDRALRRVRPSVVFHLAAYGVGGAGLIKTAKDDPVHACQVNVVGFATACRMAVEHGVERFVWSSSTSVYGSTALQGAAALGEDVAPVPDTVYGATKLAAEHLARTITDGTSTRATGLRLPSIYGAGRYPGALAELTAFVRDVAAGRAAAMEAVEDPFDWIHVDDAARALLHAAQGDGSRIVYNVVGHRSTLAELARAVAAHAEGRASVRVVERSGPPPALMDGSRFAALGFTPLFDLVSGTARYLALERERSAAHDPADV